MRVTFIVGESLAGSILADLTDRGVSELSFGTVEQVHWSRNKPRGLLPAPLDGEVLPPQRKPQADRQMLAGKRAAMSEAIMKFMSSKPTEQHDASDVTAGSGFAYDQNFRTALDKLVIDGKIKRVNVGGPTKGKIRYRYSLATAPASRKPSPGKSTKMSAAEKRAKKNERQQAYRAKVKAKKTNSGNAEGVTT